MRLLYSHIMARRGEVEVTSPFVSVFEPGECKLVTGQLSAGASIYGVWKDILAVRKDVYLYMILTVPDDIPPGIYKDADQERLAWVAVRLKDGREHDLPMSAGLDEAASYFQDTPNGKALPLDAVLGQTSHLTQRLSVLLSQRTRIVPGFVRHENAYGPSGVVVGNWGKPVSDPLIRDLVGAASVGIWHIFLSEDNRKNYVSAYLRASLSPASLQRVVSRTTVVRNGLDFETIDRWAEEAGGLKFSGRGRSVGSFYRPSALKGTEDTVLLYNEMLIANQVERAVVTWAGDEELSAVFGKSAPHSAIEFYPRSSREGWMKQAAGVAVAIFNSKNESSPICPLEAAAMGCIPLLPDRPWVWGMAKQWPLMYSSMDDAHRMVLYVLENPEMHARMAHAYVRENYDVRNLGSEMIDYIDSVIRENVSLAGLSEDEFAGWCAGSNIVKKMGALVGTSAEVAWSKVVKGGFVPRDPFGNPLVVAHHDLPILLRRKFGYVDDLSGPVPVFRPAQSTA